MASRTLRLNITAPAAAETAQPVFPRPKGVVTAPATGDVALPPAKPLRAAPIERHAWLDDYKNFWDGVNKIVTDFDRYQAQISSHPAAALELMMGWAAVTLEKAVGNALDWRQARIAFDHTVRKSNGEARQDWSSARDWAEITADPQQQKVTLDTAFQQFVNMAPKGIERPAPNADKRRRRASPAARHE